MICRLACILGLFGFFLSPAIADTPQDTVVADNAGEEVESVRLEMIVVYATDSNTAVDPQVRPLMKYFRNYKFTGFSLLDSQVAKLSDNTARTFPIEGNRKVTISLLSHSETKVRCKVIIVEGKGKKILDTTININRNGTFIVAGPKYKDGVLFLPISIKY